MATSLNNQQRDDIISMEKVLKGAHDEARRFSLQNVTFGENVASDYLKFNAYSIRDMLLRKLAADANYTGQVYPGSNISLIIDLISYVYQTLVYQLNHSASESMFADTQYYENIVRLAKMLGYNAKGMISSTAVFRVQNPQWHSHWRILPFSFVEIDGKSYSYCPSEATKSLELPSNLTGESQYDILLMNGKWRRYDKILTASGDDYETFQLNIGSNEAAGEYATTDNIFVCEVVKEYKDRTKDEIDWSNTEINWFSPTSEGLFKRKGLSTILSRSDATTSLIYSGSSTSNNRFFNVELNSDKRLVLTFGNGLETDKLHPGADLYVFYLETEGPQGSVTPSSIASEFHHTMDMFGLTEDVYANLFGLGSYDLSSTSMTITSKNTTSDRTYNCLTRTDGGDDGGGKATMYAKCVTSSSPFYAEEEVDDIKEKAPGWFKLNNRLVTKEDYEFYLRSAPEFKATLADVKVMNNWEYAATFYRWLNQLGLENHNNARYYLNSARFIKYGNASLADPADNNNVYIWYISNLKTNTVNFEQLVLQYKSIMQLRKDLTHEPVFLPAVPVTCEISGVPTELAKKLLSTSNGRTTVGTLINGEDNTWLEIRLQNNYTYTSIQDVLNKVVTLTIQHFDVQKRKVGFGPFSTNDLLNDIYANIPGIGEIYTAYKPAIGQNVVYLPGIHMNCWVNDKTLVDLGDAYWSGQQILLEEFQYPVLSSENVSQLSRRIKVVSRNSTGIL